MKGFRRAVRSAVSVSVDQHVEIDFTMTLGEVTETVTVAEAAPLINTNSREVGEVINRQRYVELPVRGRNFASLV
jgi:hypothetical protein